MTGDDSAVHLDDAAARSVGLPGVILHGMYLLGVAVQAVTAEDDPRELKSVTVQFRASAVPGDELLVEVGYGIAVHDGMEHVVRVRQQDTDLLGTAAVTLRTRTAASVTPAELGVQAAGYGC